MDLRDAHYEQCKWLVKQWRDAHKHEHFSHASNSEHYVVDSSRNEEPMGFTRGIRTITGDPEPIGVEPEERRKR